MFNRAFLSKLHLFFLSTLLLGAILLLSTSTALAKTKQTVIPSSQKYSSLNTFSMPPVFNSASNNIGNANVNTQYSQLFQNVLTGKMSQTFNDENAVALEVQYGADQNRINLTWGVLINQQQLLKITAERLTQNLPFNFITGQVKKRVPQNAFGVAYDLRPLSGIVKDIIVKGYYAATNNFLLPSIMFAFNQVVAMDLRHIAGAYTAGTEIQSTLSPVNNILIHLGLSFDGVNYRKRFAVAQARNRAALGGMIGVDALLSRHLKLEASASKRAIYDDYSATLKWLLPISSPKHPVEIKTSMERLISHNQTPNETIYLVGITFYWGAGQQDYVLQASVQPNLLSWVNKPAVYMQRVLATADESIVTSTPAPAAANQPVTIPIPNPLLVAPGVGPPGGGTAVVITGTNFTGATAVTFGGANAVAVVVVNDTTITAITPPQPFAPNPVDVAVTGPGGTGTLANGFDYQIP